MWHGMKRESGPNQTHPKRTGKERGKAENGNTDETIINIDETDTRSRSREANG